VGKRPTHGVRTRRGRLTGVCLPPTGSISPHYRRRYLRTPSTQLSVAETAKLVRCWQRGEQGATAARNRLIIANMPLVTATIAKLTYLPYRFGSDEWSDLMQAGVFGLMRAFDKFDTERGIRLSTYAVPWIRMRAQVEIMQLRSEGLYGRGTAERRAAARRAVRRAAQKLQRELTSEEQLTAAKGSKTERPETTERMLTPEQLAVPLDELAPNVTSTESALVADTDRKRLAARVLAVMSAKLPERWGKILRMRHGVGCREHSLREIGEQLGITRQRVQQLELRAVEAMRKEMKADAQP